MQEFFPVILVKFLGLSDVSIRLPFILAGAATVPAVYFMFRDKWVSLCIAAIVAIHPLFVFWSGMARPYAFAGLMAVLGWYKPAYNYLAIATTPHALFAVKWGRSYWRWAALIGLAVVMLSIRFDAGRDFLNLEFLSHAKRFWYLPALGGLVCLGRLFDGILEGRGLRAILGLVKRAG